MAGEHAYKLVFGIWIGALTLALAGLTWYVYPRLQRDDATLARIDALHQAVNALNDEMMEAGSKFAGCSRDQDDLRQQVDALGREMHSSGAGAATMQRARTQAAAWGTAERILCRPGSAGLRIKLFGKS